MLHEGQSFIRFFIGVFGKILDESCAKFQLCFEKINRKIYIEGVKFYGENAKKIGRIFSDFLVKVRTNFGRKICYN